MQWAAYTNLHIRFAGLTGLMACALSGCIEHRAAVSPPLPANPAPAGEDIMTSTTLIAGTRFQDQPDHPETFASPLPLDIPVSVYRRSGGTISRGELRVTTALPWWQRFPSDAFVDLAPVSANIDAVGMATLTPVEIVDRKELLEQAERDGYARPPAPAKSKP